MRGCFASFLVVCFSLGAAAIASSEFRGKFGVPLDNFPSWTLKTINSYPFVCIPCNCQISFIRFRVFRFIRPAMSVTVNCIFCWPRFEAVLATMIDFDFLFFRGFESCLSYEAPKLFDQVSGSSSPYPQLLNLGGFFK